MTMILEKFHDDSVDDPELRPEPAVPEDNEPSQYAKNATYDPRDDEDEAEQEVLPPEPAAPEESAAAEPAETKNEPTPDVHGAADQAQAAQARHEPPDHGVATKAVTRLETSADRQEDNESERVAAAASANAKDADQSAATVTDQGTPAVAHTEVPGEKEEPGKAPAPVQQDDGAHDPDPGRNNDTLEVDRPLVPQKDAEPEVAADAGQPPQQPPSDGLPRTGGDGAEDGEEKEEGEGRPGDDSDSPREAIEEAASRSNDTKEAEREAQIATSVRSALEADKGTMGEPRPAPAGAVPPGEAKVPTPEEVEARSEKVPRGALISAADVVRRLHIHGYNAEKFSQQAVARGVLLARRVEDEEGPNPAAHYGYSDRYLAAVEAHKEKEEIASPSDALQEVATDTWGQYLAWGIRAEYRDAMRALGSRLLIHEAAEATGMGERNLVRRGLAERLRSPNGRKAWTVPVDRLLERERWFHAAFDNPNHEPEPVEFCTVSRAAMILDAPLPTIGRLRAQNLLPAWHVPAAEKRGALHIPVQYLEALRAFHDRHSAVTLAWSAREFRRLNPVSHTIIRGQFEEYAAHLKKAEPDISMEGLMRILGVERSFFWHNKSIETDGVSPIELLQHMVWVSSKDTIPSSREFSSGETRREVVAKVLEGTNPKELAPQYDVSVKQIYVWLRQAKRGRL